jgi:hypothetical protein
MSGVCRMMSVMGVAVLLRHGHVHARHEREVEGHVAFLSLAEIGAGVLGPLVGLCKQQAIGEVRVEIGADLLQDVVRLREILVVRPLALDQVGDRVEPQPVDSHLQPEAHGAEHLLEHARIVEVEVRLVRIEAMPEEGVRLRVPRPIRLLRIDEDDARAEIALVGVAPDVEIARRRAGLGAPRLLEPRMLVGGVVDDKLGDDADAAPVRFGDEAAEVAHVSVGRIDRAVVGDIVAVVAERRGIEGQDPDDVDAETFDIVEALDQPGEIADAIAVGIVERLDVQLIDDGFLVPIALRAIDGAVALARSLGLGGLCRPRRGGCIHQPFPLAGWRRQIA